MKRVHRRSIKVKSEFGVMMLGNESVGKSTLLKCFLECSSNAEPTVGAQTFVKSLLIKNRLVKLNICDTSGQLRFKVLQRTYYKTCNGAVVTYDIHNRRSFEEAKEWVKELREEVSPEIVIALAGNKNDIHDDREVTLAEANAYANENKLIFMETSALTAVNVEACFMALANALYLQYRTRVKAEKKKTSCCGLSCWKKRTTTDTERPEV